MICADPMELGRESALTNASTWSPRSAQTLSQLTKTGVNVDKKGFCDIFGRTFLQLYQK